MLKPLIFTIWFISASYTNVYLCNHLLYALTFSNVPTAQPIIKGVILLSLNSLFFVRYLWDTVGEYLTPSPKKSSTVSNTKRSL